MLKNVKWSSVLSSIAFIVIGLLVIIYPNLSATVVAYIIGIGFAIFGVINIFAYFMLDIQDTLNRNDFVVGLMALIFGIMVIFKQDLIASLIPLILGLIIMTSGFAKLQRAVISKRIGYSDSMIYIILALISIAFGIVIIFFLNGDDMASILFIVIGVGLVYCGISDLFANFFLAAKFNKFVKTFKEAAKKNDSDQVIDVQVTNETTEETTDNETK